MFLALKKGVGEDREQVNQAEEKDFRKLTVKGILHKH